MQREAAAKLDDLLNPKAAPPTQKKNRRKAATPAKSP